MNTKSQGQVTFMTVLRDDGVYVGVCYELAIVLENTNQEKLIKDLNEAAMGYINVVRENNLSDSLLDRHDNLPKDLQTLHDVLEKRLEEGASKHKHNAVHLPAEYKNAVETGRAQLSTACV